MAEDKNTNGTNGFDLSNGEELHDILPVSGMYENWFLDYASYVILERAVPTVEDGLKPVQRRIMHAMREMEDGRYNKVANIIGNTMQYHPHGDASISDAIVGLGQKNLLIDTQGNWGDLRTGDSAAAPRYIEARLSKFALEVLFNPQTTEWQLSYDGRKKEPVTLPVKFPLLLAQGVDGIAVGLSTKILPHNFNELLDASINLLKGKKTSVFPDFYTGGMADFTEYNDGLRGGRIRIRAKIEEHDKKTLVIKDIPYGTTTTTLIESIIRANDKGKIKIKKVVDNTARDVEILVSLAPGQSPHITIDALYAFTDCEVSISPNACVIVDDKPRFMGVSEILKVCNDQTVNLLQRELEIKKAELLEKILFSSLEKIFIENRIYRDIEECETWESVIETIDKGLGPFKKQFYREITEEDIIRLTEIKIKRISKFDSYKADEQLKKLEEDLAEVEYNLANLVEYVIKYYERLKEKYGKDKERKTEIRNFDSIAASVVAANNQKLYVNRADGFIGYGLKKDEYVCECSDIDDIIAFRRDGKFTVTKIDDKVYVGKDVLHAGVFNRNDERMVYNMVYLDGKSGKSMVKRFQVLGVTRDKEYDLTTRHKGSKILYITANPNGEAEVITINLTSGSRARKKMFDFDFSTLDIKGRSAKGNILTKYPIRKIQMKSEGVSTLGGLDIWYDQTIGRLNREERGKFLGNFMPEDLVLVLYRDGSYAITNFDLMNKYDPEQVASLEKFNPQTTISAVYYHGGNKAHYVKRFKVETSSLNKKFNFIAEERGSKLELVTTGEEVRIRVKYNTKRKDTRKEDEFLIEDLIDVKGWKAVGNKLGSGNIKSVELLNGKVNESFKDEKNNSREGQAVVDKGSESDTASDGDASSDGNDKRTVKKEISKDVDNERPSDNKKDTTGIKDAVDEKDGFIEKDALIEKDPNPGKDSGTEKKPKDKTEPSGAAEKQKREDKPDPDKKISKNDPSPGSISNKNQASGTKDDEIEENKDSSAEKTGSAEKSSGTSSDKDDYLDVGSTVEFDFKKPAGKNDQLGLFREE